MGKLELKHLAPYLPYGLKCQYEGIVNGKDLKKWDDEINLVNYSDYAGYIIEFPRPKEVLSTKIALIKGVKFYNNYFKVEIGTYHGHLKSFVNAVGFKPILRPLSDLTEKMLRDHGFNCHVDYLTNEYNHWVKTYGVDKVINDLPYGHAVYLFSNHFDTFGLTKKGLAVDINTIES